VKVIYTKEKYMDKPQIAVTVAEDKKGNSETIVILTPLFKALGKPFDERRNLPGLKISCFRRCRDL